MVRLCWALTTALKTEPYMAAHLDSAGAHLALSLEVLSHLCACTMWGLPDVPDAMGPMLNCDCFVLIIKSAYLSVPC